MRTDVILEGTTPSPDGERVVAMGVMAALDTSRTRNGPPTSL
ncbi:hypothetical protein [Streptomyces sp. URMC 123]